LFTCLLVYLFTCLLAPQNSNDQNKVENVCGRIHAYHNTSAVCLSIIESVDRFRIRFDNKYNSFLFSKNL